MQDVTPGEQLAVETGMRQRTEGGIDAAELQQHLLGLAWRTQRLHGASALETRAQVLDHTLPGDALNLPVD
jgi:hypothetical protein